MRLGDALMAAFGGAGPSDYVPQGAAAELVEHYGSVAGAARALDVPRRTFRGWLAGRSPRGGGGWLGDVAREFWRAEHLSESVSASVPATGTGNTMKGTEHRRISIGGYLAPGTVDRVRDLYLGGGDADELARTFHSGITDQGFYADTFDPDNDMGYWDIEWIDLDEGEIEGSFEY